MKTTSNQWRFEKTAFEPGDILDWDEGHEGKGIIDRTGHVYTWTDEDYEVHNDFLEEHPDVLPMRYFWIEPNGLCRGAGMGDELDQQDEEVLHEADPRLFVRPHEENSWSFAA